MSLVQMSRSAAVMILAVIILRALTLHTLPKRTFPVLWDIVLARLLLPLSVPCALSVYTLLARLSGGAAPAAAGLPSALTAPAPAAPAAAAPITVPAATAAAAAARADWRLPVWLLGALACAVFFTAAYIRCRRQFRESLPVDNGFAAKWLAAHALRRKISLRQSDRISAPLTYGVLRPVILMPKRADWNDTQTMAYVLEHEYVHIRRFDAARKLLLAAACCLHWFNPLVWCMYALANRDIELSCDEAVLRRLGHGSRAAYAMALIRMEETGSGPAPLLSGFGKNAVEERITAIMKMKKTSLAAALAALCLVTGVTTVFATSELDREAADRAANNQPVTEADTVLSYTGPDGTTLYSLDEGRTFISQAEYDALHPKTDVVWWTYDEYAAWLEEEKINLQSMLGERGWTGGRGEFVWTQEEIDKTIALYEEILEEIGRGVLVSKTVDGSEDVMLTQGVGDMMLGVGESCVTAADFLEYATYGLEWDEGAGALFFKGERVRYFLDGAQLDGGTAIRLEYADAQLEGEIDVYAVRRWVDNGDGSYNPMGPLTGLEKYSQEEFDEHSFTVPELVCEAYFQQVSAAEAAQTEKLLNKYAPFGLTWELDSGREDLSISMSWQGKPVHSVFDSVEGVWIANNMHGSDLGPGAVDLEAVYENGKLTGLREAEAQGPVTEAYAIAAGTDTEAGDPGVSFGDIFEKYAPFGITYEEAEGASGAGNVYCGGKLVSQFADIRPDGGVFTFSSADGGELSVQTVYGEDGRLSGVKEFTQPLFPR